MSKQNEGQNRLFPIFLKLEHLQTLLVGGGNVGLEKLEALLKNSPEAEITLVADFVKDEVQQLAALHPRVNILHRKFEMADLENKDMVVLATDNPSLHAQIRQETRKRRILTNVADTPDLCDFYLGSVVRKGDLKIAISTNGKSPTMAKRLRQFFEEFFPDNMQDILLNLRSLREQLKGDFQHKLKVLEEVTASFAPSQKSSQQEKEITHL
ncbi:MAG: bifunctional precorrin-2 dehydrogenase/sirohydrochlorin ferrochelatase [Cyclobacteriaceae bacterium]